MTTTVLCAPLSRAQERMWFVDAANGGNPTYNVPLFLRWTEQIDVAALTAALNVVISRHQALRTTYQLQDTQVVQVVADPQPIAVTMIDLTSVPTLFVGDSRRASPRGCEGDLNQSAKHRINQPSIRDGHCRRYLSPFLCFTSRSVNFSRFFVEYLLTQIHLTLLPGASRSTSQSRD